MTPEPRNERPVQARAAPTGASPNLHGPGLSSSDPPPTTREEHLLHAATDALRRSADARWVEVSDRVLAAAMTATRRSLPLRAMAPGGPVQVSEQVVVAHLRAAIDAAVADAATASIGLQVTDREVLSGVVVQLVARYGQPLLPVADRVREVAVERLLDLLGPPAATVTVAHMQVHFCDVTTGNPHTAGS